MLFSRRRNIGSPSLNINGSPLTFVDSFRYLGVTFDTKLTYRNHVDTVVTKCSNQMNLMKLLTRTYWGAGKKSLLKIYRSLIRPVIEYGMPAYFFSTRTQQKKIETIQNQALRICCGAMPSTPICVLQASCHEMPLHIRHLYLCLTYRYHLLSCTARHPSLSVISDSWHDLYCLTNPNFKTFNYFTKNVISNDLSVSSTPAILKPPWLISVPLVDTRLLKLTPSQPSPQRTKVTSLDYINDTYEENGYVTIYTDGSKMENGAGYSVFIPCLGIGIARKCEAVHSPYFVELMAIARATSWILARTSSDKKYVIFCDCLSAIEALGNPLYSFEHPIINEIMSASDLMLRRGYHVIYAWVPGHVGIPGNEKSDQLARKAALSSDTISESRPFSKSEAKALLSEYCCTSWNREYQGNERGSAYKILFPSVHQRSIPATSRKYETILFRLRSGHCRLRAHLCKIGCSDSSLCEICHSPETVTHFLLHCPQYESNRSLLKKVTAELNIPFTLHMVLCDPRLLIPAVEFTLASGKFI